MRGRNDEKKKTSKFPPVPGPGAYDVKLHTEKGKYILSKFPSNTTMNFASLTSKRFVYPSN